MSTPATAEALCATDGLDLSIDEMLRGLGGLKGPGTAPGRRVPIAVGNSTRAAIASINGRSTGKTSPGRARLGEDHRKAVPGRAWLGEDHRKAVPGRAWLGEDHRKAVPGRAWPGEDHQGMTASKASQPPGAAP